MTMMASLSDAKQLAQWLELTTLMLANHPDEARKVLSAPVRPLTDREFETHILECKLAIIRLQDFVASVEKAQAEYEAQHELEHMSKEEKENLN